MAIDTQQKRMSALSHGRPWMRGRVYPSGTIDAAERAAIGMAYSGNAIWAGGAPSTPGGENDSDTVVLLHLNEEAGSTTFVNTGVGATP